MFATPRNEVSSGHWQLGNRKHLLLTQLNRELGEVDIWAGKRLAKAVKSWPTGGPRRHWYCIPRRAQEAALTSWQVGTRGAPKEVGPQPTPRLGVGIEKRRSHWHWGLGEAAA